MRFRRFAPYLLGLALFSGCDSGPYQTAKSIREETPQERTARVMQQQYVEFRDSSGEKTGQCFNTSFIRAKLAKPTKPEQLPQEAKPLCEYFGDFGSDGKKRSVGVAATNDKAWIYTNEFADNVGDKLSGSSVIEVPARNFQLTKFNLLRLFIQKSPQPWQEIVLEYKGNNRREIRLFANIDKRQSGYKQIGYAEGEEFCLQNLDLYASLTASELIAISKNGKSVTVHRWDAETGYTPQPFVRWLYDTEDIYIRMQLDGTYRHIMITEELVKQKQGDIDMLYHTLFGMKKKEVLEKAGSDPAALTKLFIDHYENQNKKNCGFG